MLCSGGPVAVPTRLGALDVHAHAMPLPLLQRLADRDWPTSTRSRRHRPARPAGQRCRPARPLPWPGPCTTSTSALGDGRGRASTGTRCRCRRSCSPRPPRTRSWPPDVVRRATTMPATYVADAPDRLLGLGSVPLGWPGAAEEARRCLDDLGLAGIAIGSRGGGPRPRRPGQRRPVGAAVRTPHVRVPAPQRRARPAAADGLLAAPARRLPDGDRPRQSPAWCSAGCSSATR